MRVDLDMIQITPVMSFPGLCCYKTCYKTEYINPLFCGRWLYVFFFLKVRGWRLHRGPHHHHLPDRSRRQLHWLLWTEQNSTRDCRVNHNPGRITLSPLFGSLLVPRHSPTIPSFPWRTKNLLSLHRERFSDFYNFLWVGNKAGSVWSFVFRYPASNAIPQCFGGYGPPEPAWGWPKSFCHPQAPLCYAALNITRLLFLFTKRAIVWWTCLYHNPDEQVRDSEPKEFHKVPGIVISCSHYSAA